MALLDDVAVAQRILDHIRDHTTDVGDDVWREPVENYRSPDRLEREIERVLRRSPTPFCPSAALPEPGSFVARDVAGVATLVVRGDDGRVRAFRNACRHRGTLLAEGRGRVKAFVCPYHAWAYGLDGRLNHIPHAYGFPGLAKEDHGLVPIRAEERVGLVFLTLEPEAEDAAAEPWAGLPELTAPDQELMDVIESELAVNWKIFLEGALEGYHIRATHKDSFYPYGFDNLNLVETCGRHSRVTFPFRRIEKLADVPPRDRRVEGLLTYVYHLFPNAVLTVLSRHINLVVAEPLATDRTRLVTYRLGPRAENEEAARQARRDADFVSQTGAAEDRDIVESIQRGVASGANDVYTFGHFEKAIVHFHRELDTALSDAN